MIDYRTDRLKAAENRALTYGYKGAMFPWESDDKGEEATPINALTGQFEHHITADIAIAYNEAATTAVGNVTITVV
jgi:trehalose/maltose hydrolase-like predicted phosphorylase